MNEIIIDVYCRSSGEDEYDEWCIHDRLTEGFCADICSEYQKDKSLCQVYRCEKILKKLFPKAMEDKQ